jgi:ElaB/YqjD/DUF883 family membrane-anchored ribosome-binding protein
MSDTNGAAHKVEGMAEEAQKRADRDMQDLKREARKRGNQVRKDVVHQLHTAADSLRDQVRQATDNTEVHQGVDEVATGLERAAHYLNKHSVEDMGQDATRTIMRNPWQTMVIAMLVGIFFGLFLSGNKER